jgi:hypothetical protein
MYSSAPYDVQDDPHRNRKSLPRRIVLDLRIGKLIVLPARSECAPPAARTFFTHSDWLL